MPKATVDVALEEKFDLKSCAGGYVVLRRMTYGQTLERLDIAQRVQIEGNQKTKRISGEMIAMNTAVTAFEFRCCIVEHNLEDDDARPLNLSSAQDLAKLDPRIGEEIANLIEEMNKFNDQDAVNS